MYSGEVGSVLAVMRYKRKLAYACCKMELLGQLCAAQVSVQGSKSLPSYRFGWISLTERIMGTDSRADANAIAASKWDNRR